MMLIRSGLMVMVTLLPLVALAQEGEENLLSLSLEELSGLEINIATGTPKSLEEAPAAASVITAQDLADMGAQDLDEALEAIPGLHVSHGSFLDASRYFIRGIVSTYNPQTLVLINGIPQSSLFLGDRGERVVGMTGIPVQMIARVEIIRGPGSALYGADAFAGVINIITKDADDVQGGTSVARGRTPEATDVQGSTSVAGGRKPGAADPLESPGDSKEDPRGQATLGVGNFNSAHASLQQTAMLGPAHTIYSLYYSRTGGDRPIVTSDQQSNIDAQLGTHASLAPGPANLGVTDFDARSDMAWQDWRLRFSYRRSDNQTAQGINNTLNPGADFQHHHATADLTWHPALSSRVWDLQTQTSYLYSDFRNPGYILLFPPGAVGGAFPQGVIERPELAEQNARLDLKAAYTGWQDHRWLLGSGYFWGSIFKTDEFRNYAFNGPVPTPLPAITDVSDTPVVFVPEGARTNAYAFMQDEWRMAPRWQLTAGVRRDYFSDFGGATDPRLALVWRTSSTLTSKLLYGEAFRAPAFFELYASGNPVALGNPHLRPEKLKSTELAFSYKPPARWSWDLNIYHLRIRDYIDFVNNPGQPTFTAQNVGRIDGRGVETEWHYYVSPTLQLLANYSLQDTRNTDTDTPLGLTPRDKIYARAVWHMAPNWLLTPQITREGETLRPAGDTRPPLAAHTSVDLTLKWLWRPWLDYSLIARNLLSADLREASRGPGPGETMPDIAHDLPQPGRSVVVEMNARW